MFVFDFDDTIFDSKSYKKLLFNIKWNLRHEELAKKYEEIINQFWFFNFSHWCKTCNIDIKEFEKTGTDYPQFVFNDFISFKNKFPNQKFILLTFWDKYFQNFKIKNSQIHTQFNEIVITNKKDKIDDLRKLYHKYKEKIIYIENNIFSKSSDFNFPIDIIKINRFDNNYEIRTLDNILEKFLCLKCKKFNDCPIYNIHSSLSDELGINFIKQCEKNV